VENGVPEIALDILHVLWNILFKVNVYTYVNPDGKLGTALKWNDAIVDVDKSVSTSGQDFQQSITPSVDDPFRFKIYDRSVFS
jgi:hypothetical protein